MKKLFLASSGLTYIKEFVGAPPASMNMLFIPTAGNLDDDIWWIDKDLDVLTKMGFQIHQFDIEGASRETLTSALDDIAIVYIAGGNTFYLLKQLRQTGFDKLLIDFVAKGGLYAGASAGALVAGLDIQPVAALDEPEKVQGLDSTKGLGLTNTVPIPHYDFQNRKSQTDIIKQTYGKQFDIILLTDDQALVVQDDSYKVVESPRSSLEMQWLNNSSDA
jgi:dipeptidase E